MEYLSVISSAAAFLVSGLAFTYGALKLLKINTLAYFHFLIWGVACFMLLSLSACVNYLCNAAYEPYISIGSFGSLGVYIAFLCANSGVLDKIVDEKLPETRKYRYIALIVPVLALVAVTWLFSAYFKKGNTVSGIIMVALCIPMISSCYFNIKHLLLPADAMGILKATAGCNAMCLVFTLIEFLYMFAVSFDALVFANLFFFLRSVALLLLMIFSVKGAKKWLLQN